MRHDGVKYNKLRDIRRGGNERVKLHIKPRQYSDILPAVWTEWYILKCTDGYIATADIVLCTFLNGN